MFAGTIALVAVYGQSSSPAPFAQGDVFIGTPLGSIYHYSGQGNPLGTLNTGEQSGSSVTGMCFDKEGSLYAVNFNANTISKFNISGQLTKYPWGGPFYFSPSNCVVDSSGNIYVGEYYLYSGDVAIEKFASDGTLLSTYYPASQEYTAHQIWIDLAPDNCTIYYTNNATTIKRFNICTNSQQNDFITPGPPGTGYDAVHVRPNGEVFATLAGKVIRLSATGNILATYTFPDSNESNAISSFSFDIDNTHFWAGAPRTGNVYKVDIEAGTGTNTPIFSVASACPNCQPQYLTGLAIHGSVQDTHTPVIEKYDNPAWAGYAAVGVEGSPVYFKKVESSWTVPKLKCPGITKLTKVSYWVGLGGFNNPDLEQIGTYSQCTVGIPVHFGIWEMITQGKAPGAKFIINLRYPILSNDHMKASVEYLSNGIYQLTLENITRGWRWSESKAGSTKETARQTADCIVEWPPGSVLPAPLSNFGKFTFEGCRADNSPLLTYPRLYQFTLKKGNVVMAVPSSINSNSDFIVTWQHE